MKTLLIDWDGVILRTEDVSTGLNKMRTDLNIDMDIRLVLIMEMGALLDTGKITFKEFLKELNARMKKKDKKYDAITEEQYFDALLQDMKFNIELVNFLVKIKGVKKVLFTNNFEANFSRMKKKLNISTWTDMIISSHDYKTKKPDREIYELALLKTKSKPEECFIIDDQEKNVETGLLMGMKGIVHTSNSETITAIERFLKK